MSSICFVTDEVMPFTMGGIGAFMRNTLDHYSDHDHIYVLYTGDKHISDDEWNLRYPNVRLFALYNFFDTKRNKWERLSFEHPFLKRSMIIKECLVELEKWYDFSHIEFVDWGGLSFYTQQARLSRLAFENTAICVRIHTTDGLLRRFEGRGGAFETSLLSDLERKSLADADIVIAHLEPVAEYVAQFYGFPDSWLKAVKISTPPVKVDREADALHPIDSKTTSIAFTSKLQSIKRPEIFIRGVSLFLEQNPQFEGNVLLTAMEPIAGWSDRMRALIPNSQLHRFIFRKDLTQEERIEAIAKSVVVFPNAYEAFCFAAYEASKLGAVCVLNANNVAFGDATPWKDKKNCFKFDGTAVGLSIALKEIFFQHRAKLVPVNCLPDETPYWRNHIELAPLADTSNSFGLIILITQLSMLNIKTLFNLISQTPSVSEIVVVVEARVEVADSPLLKRLLEIASQDKRLKIVKFEPKLNRGSLLNYALDIITCDYVFYCPGGTDVMPGSLEASVESLRRNAAFDVILPISNVLNDGDDLSDKPLFTFCSVGEGIATNMIKNRLAAHAFFARTSVLKKFYFDEHIETLHEWELLSRMAIGGTRMICWPEVIVGYPERVAAALSPSSNSEGEAAKNKVRENLVWKSKGGAGTLSLLSDAAEKIYVEPPLQQHVDTRGQEIDVEQLAEIYNKSLKKARAKFRPTLIPRPNFLQKMYVHVDFLNQEAGHPRLFKVQSGNDLSIVGWWRTQIEVDERCDFKLVAKMKGSTFDFMTTNYKRLDVSVMHHLPTKLNLGFTATISGSLLGKGKYKVYGHLTLGQKVILTRKVLEIEFA